MYDVFLSYNKEDIRTVKNIALRLAQGGEIEPFLDKWCIKPGEIWQEEIEKVINNSASCAVFVGSSGLGPWQNEEMRVTIERRVSDPNFRVIPVLLPGTSTEVRNNLPPFLRRSTWVDMGRGIDDENAFSALASEIKGEAPRRSLRDILARARHLGSIMIGYYRSKIIKLPISHYLMIT